MAIRLSEVINKPLYNEVFQLIAGEKGLYRNISNITVMEVKDFTSFELSKDLLILTTFSFCTNIESMQKTFTELTKQNISGIAVKINRYIKEIPECLINSANEHSIPLFQIKPDISFSKVISNITALMIEPQYNELRNFVDEYEQLHAFVLKGESIEFFIRKLALSISHTCLCVLPDGSIAAKYAVKPFSSDIDTKELIHDFEKSREHTIGITSQEYNYVQTANHNYLIFPCVGFSQVLGYLVVEVCSSASPELIFKAKPFSSVLSIKLIEDSIKNEQAKKHRSQAFLDILYNEHSSSSDMKAHFKTIGFTADDVYIMLFITPDNLDAFKNEVMSKPDKVHEIISLLSSHSDNHLFEEYNQGYLVLLSYKSSSISNAPPQTANLAAQLYEIISMPDVKICHSEPESKWLHLHETLKKVLNALQYGMSIYPEKTVYSTKQFVEFEIYKKIMNTPEHDLFKESIILPIRKYDQTNNIELWKTLEVCILSENLQEASDRLFVHITTIRYRLDKIEKITGVNYFTSIGKVHLTSAYILKKLEDIESRLNQSY